MKLIHPIYLDVPMLVSFSAAIQGGVTYTTEIVNEDNKKSSEEKKAGMTFGLPKLFASLFDLNASIEGVDASSNNKTQTTKENRAHTEASIAILLYNHLLKEENYFSSLQTLDDVEKLEPGNLVELEGVIEKNAIDSVIDFMNAIEIFTSPPESDSKKKGKNTHGEGVYGVKQIRDSLERDRKRTPISNVHFRCRKPDGLNAVLTLRTANLRDLTLSELHKNSVRVVGKVTRKISPKEKMCSFENYGMAILPVGTISKMLNDIKDSAAMNISLGEVEITGPAIQILPLMIYV